ncbi:MAG: hypothetical protein D6692_10645 [Planctomycetota bacterium]|nr:MAG: hypothetical protein D6692_10645 [Planctomycetota bacterium]
MLAAGLLAAGLQGVGCSGLGSGDRGDGRRVRIEPADFSTGQTGGTPAAAVSADPMETGPSPTPDDGVVIRPAVPQARPAAVASAPEGLALIEAKVGDINGKPIYLSSFFEPIEARLKAEAERLRLSAWRREAAQVIAQRLDGLIADELLRAEALSALSPQQRQGLRAFLTNFRDDILTQNLGSAQLASRRGQSLDQALRDKEIETLVSLTLFQEVNKRVNVSWRDIRQRYERDFEQYNPPPTAVFRLIRVPSADETAVAEITARLENGEPFGVVATHPANTFFVEDGGLARRPFEGEFAEGDFFPAEDLNQKARSLSEGETTGPFTLGNFTCWLTLEGIEQESISLYDAQLRINRDLLVERRTEARTEYLKKLIDHARVSNRDEILLSLLRIAEERYGPKE